MSRFEHYRTPLHFAVLKNRPDMVRLLLELGADPRARDSRGYTPLNFAKAESDPPSPSC
jgi:ankyrin repeat protein